MTSPAFTVSPALDDRLLVDAGVLVRALELDQVVDVGLGRQRIVRARPASDARRCGVASTDSTMPSRLATTRDAGVAGDDALDAGADERRRGADERHRLALHVRAHERAVRVVVLEERDQRGGDRHQLVRRHVHQRRRLRASTMTNSPLWRHETRSSANLPFLSIGGVRLGDVVPLLLRAPSRTRPRR